MIHLLNTRSKKTQVQPPPLFGSLPDVGVSGLINHNALDVSLLVAASFSPGSVSKEIVIHFIDTKVPLGVVHEERIPATEGENELSFSLPTPSDPTAPRIFYDEAEVFAQDETGVSAKVRFPTGSLAIDFDGTDGWLWPATSVSNLTNDLIDNYVKTDFSRGGLGIEALKHTGGEYEIFSTGGPNNGPFIRFRLNKDAQFGRQRSEIELDGKFNQDFADKNNVDPLIPENRDRVITTGAQNFRNWTILNNGFDKDQKQGRAFWELVWMRDPTAHASVAHEITSQWGKRFDGTGPPPGQSNKGSRTGGSRMNNWVQVNTDFDITSFDLLGDGGQNSGIKRGRWGNWHDLGPDAEYPQNVGIWWLKFVYLSGESDGIIRIWKDFEENPRFELLGANMYNTGTDGEHWFHPHIGLKIGLYRAQWNTWEGEPSKEMDYACWRVFYDKREPIMYSRDFFQQYAANFKMAS